MCFSLRGSHICLWCIYIQPLMFVEAHFLPESDLRHWAIELSPLWSLSSTFQLRLAHFVRPPQGDALGEWRDFSFPDGGSRCCRSALRPLRVFRVRTGTFGPVSRLNSFYFVGVGDRRYKAAAASMLTVNPPPGSKGHAANKTFQPAVSSGCAN